MQAMDLALTQLIDRIQAAAAAAQPLRIRGGGSKDFYGQTLQGDVLDTRGLQGIVSYEPSELVVTSRLSAAPNPLPNSWKIPSTNGRPSKRYARKLGRFKKAAVSRALAVPAASSASEPAPPLRASLGSAAAATDIPKRLTGSR